MRVSPTFRGRSLFWATTYTFDPDLFGQFLLRRMGGPPRNAVVLADHGRLAEVWERLLNEPWRLASVNALYLVRGIPMSGAFHPKTYLVADERRGSLFVGSGNLTLSGIEQGNEVFTRFDSEDDHGMESILAWAKWMDGLVEITDSTVQDRWRALRRSAEWLRGDPPSKTAFITNADSSIIDQLTAELAGPVDELHVTAPFFDPRASALAELLARTDPRSIHLYLADDTSVDGSALTTVLNAAKADLHLWRYGSGFVHAKLVGVTTRAGEAIILSGSANLSTVALLAAYRSGDRANAEAGVLSHSDPDSLRRLFRPSGLEVTEAQLTDLEALRFEQDETTNPARSFVLRAARFTEDDRVEVDLAGEPLPEEVELGHIDGVVPLDGLFTATAVPLERETATVWLVRDGEAVSNVVPVDDPRSLAAQLQAGNDRANRPRELDLSDLDTPVGQLLVRLQADCIFDLDELPVNRGVRVSQEGETEEDDALWERLQREELELDPRIAGYRSFANPNTRAEDELLLQLRAMLGHVPGQQGLRLVPPTPTSPPSPGGGDGVTGRWSPEQRLRVRLFNVLARWSKALSDSRFFWLGPEAGVRNYVALLAAITQCWADSYLDEDKIRELLCTLFEAFIRGERHRGYLWLLDEEDRAAAAEAIPTEARELAAALVCSVFRDSGHAHPYIFRWQAFLIPGLELGVIRGGADAAEAIKVLADVSPSAEEVGRRLENIAHYINDERWRERLVRELGLETVTFETAAFRDARTMLNVEPPMDLLRDPRVPRLVREALDYRTDEPAVIIRSGDARLRAERNGKAGLLRGGQLLPITDKLTQEALLKLDSASRPFLDLQQRAA